ncbi:MFS transporter [Maribacter aurantiacus]|uniref:MFS transporter n=1 Tax=Maribacter aurantiacus TaxID=1882343 RepID=A0A5R8M5R7_9FLAO|nr:MFS transporter [Maribacter aurantiacus]TLF44109.1 MFS transporter [Maribacter aurantiacus]
MKQKPHILPTIIIAQFACTSPWFAGNTIVDELILKTGLGHEIMGWVLSSVQLGFIAGTLLFALFMIADRFSPSKVFMVCAFLAALCNLYLITDQMTKWSLLLARFGTGFFLAGIYPVGMKIAADYYKKGLGMALGFLVGALVLGTGFPYLINSTAWGSDPYRIIVATSAFTCLGGALMYFLVPDGPFLKKSSKVNLYAGPRLFKISTFRKAAFGYFGHMWELYAFWAFTPLAIESFNIIAQNDVSVPLWTGIIIALGSVSCGLGGILSQYIGSKKVATAALLLSGFCCLISPFTFSLTPMFFLFIWCIWGMGVTMDSPQFSKLVATSINNELKGTGLTLVNCIGFAISIVSIESLSMLTEIMDNKYLFTVLAIGPLFGLWHIKGAKNH